MRGLIDMGRKGYESSIDDHDIELFVMMVGWVDVLDRDVWRAVDISIFNFL